VRLREMKVLSNFTLSQMFLCGSMVASFVRDVGYQEANYFQGIGDQYRGVPPPQQLHL